MAHRLSASSASKVLLCEAGQDTPPGNEPPEIRDSYSGAACASAAKASCALAQTPAATRASNRFIETLRRETV